MAREAIASNIRNGARRLRYNKSSTASPSFFRSPVGNRKNASVPWAEFRVSNSGLAGTACGAIHCDQTDRIGWMLARLNKSRRLKAGWCIALAYLFCVLAPSVSFAFADSSRSAPCIVEDHDPGMHVHMHESAIGRHLHDGGAVHDHVHSASAAHEGMTAH
jgi:hypothetical protein